MKNSRSEEGWSEHRAAGVPDEGSANFSFSTAAFRTYYSTGAALRTRMLSETGTVLPLHITGIGGIQNRMIPEEPYMDIKIIKFSSIPSLGETLNSQIRISDLCKA